LKLPVIYAIPGLGTTKELFEKTAVAGHELVVLEWPDPTPSVSLSQYASMFLKQIDSTQPVNLMGVSFGGMICMELADRIPVKSLTLISSAKCRKELPVLIRLLKRVPLNKALSERMHRMLAVRSRWFVGFEKRYHPVFRRMIWSMPPGYFKNCISMIVRWNREQPGYPVFHLHGDADRLLPRRFILNCTTIKNGTHAMIVNQAPAINQLLNAFYNER
jgi:pimeloyl-ACP methyl ester carboxylesterase